MKVSAGKGICISSGSTTLRIDAKAEEHGVITHAHSDHCHSCNGSSTYLMSAETAALMGARGLKPRNSAVVELGRKVEVSDFGVTLHNSGHILGSAQVLVEGPHTVAVTSDFKLQSSLILKPAEILHADTLVIETTFGTPSFSFPSREDVYTDMAAWLKSQLALNNFIVLAGYSIGKAQELTRIANEFAGTAPLVHETIFDANRVYEQHGVKLGDYIPLKHNLSDSNILIMPPSLVDSHLLHALSYSLGRRVVSAVASGWCRKGHFTKCFPLSDHADFAQLMRYVKESEPKAVLTTHGYAREFAGFVSRRLGIPARALGNSSQRSIAEYLH